jgi:predicted permease
LTLSKDWKLSGTVYTEVAYRSIQMSRGQSQFGTSSSEQDMKKRFNVAMSSAKTSKIAFAVLGTIGAAFPFLEYVVASSPEAIISGVSLSLAISLAYIVFYSLQILPSFSSGEPYSILMTLPLDERDFSIVAVLSLLRTFDYIALSTTIVQVASIWILTHSIIASGLMLGGSIINVVFAMGLALWFSGIFYKNVSRGGRSRKATIGRSLFLITWGVAALSIGFVFNFISYLLPYLTSAILGIYTRPAGLLLLIIHPFSIGFAISNVVYPNLFSSIPLPSRTVLLIPRFVPQLLAIISTIFYFLLAVGVGRSTLHSIGRITRGVGSKLSRPIVKDYLLRTRSPLQAYVIKDLRLASMNPSLAFLYAAPMFEVLTLAVITVQFPVMRATAMIISTIVGCFFSTMICSTLLNTEGTGLEYSMSLPLSSKTIINAKAMIAALTFVPVPIALLAIALSKPVVSDYILIIPFVELVAVCAACVGEIGFFLRPSGNKGANRQARGFSMMAGADIKRLIQSLGIAFAIILSPIVTYSITFVLTLDHPISIGAMTVIAITELLVALVATGRMN